MQRIQSQGRFLSSFLMHDFKELGGRLTSLIMPVFVAY